MVRTSFNIYHKLVQLNAVCQTQRFMEIKQMQYFLQHITFVIEFGEIWHKMFDPGNAGNVLKVEWMPIIRIFSIDIVSDRQLGQMFDFLTKDHTEFMKRRDFVSFVDIVSYRSMIINLKIIMFRKINIFRGYEKNGRKFLVNPQFTASLLQNE